MTYFDDIWDNIYDGYDDMLTHTIGRGEDPTDDDLLGDYGDSESYGYVYDPSVYRDHQECIDAWRKVKKEERAKIAEEKPHLSREELNSEAVESTAAIIYESEGFLPYICHTLGGADEDLEDAYRCERKLIFKSFPFPQTDEARARDFHVAGKQADEKIFEAYGKLPLYRKREERALRARRTPAPVPSPVPSPAPAPVYRINTVYAEIPSLNLFDETILDNKAKSSGYAKLSTDSSKAPMASYKKGSTRLNFWLTTGTVGSYLTHPSKGKTQLFRRSMSREDALKVFDDPREHTGIGYHTKEENSKIQKKKDGKKDGKNVKCSVCDNVFNLPKKFKGKAPKCKQCR